MPCLYAGRIHEGEKVGIPLANFVGKFNDMPLRTRAFSCCFATENGQRADNCGIGDLIEQAGIAEFEGERWTVGKLIVRKRERSSVEFLYIRELIFL